MRSKKDAASLRRSRRAYFRDELEKAPPKKKGQPGGKQKKRGSRRKP